jgi:hypothetical protein
MRCVAGYYWTSPFVAIWILTTSESLYTERLSNLGQAMEDSGASFSDILVSGIVANMFHFVENRTDWNNAVLTAPSSVDFGPFFLERD